MICALVHQFAQKQLPRGREDAKCLLERNTGEGQGRWRTGRSYQTISRAGKESTSSSGAAEQMLLMGGIP